MSAWSDQDAEPDYDPDRSAGFDWRFRRWPAAIRLLGLKSQQTLPVMDEKEAWGAVRLLIARKHRKNLASSLDPNNHEKFRHWLHLCVPLRRWWASNDGWRSPREPQWYWDLERSIDAPHMEPSEIAAFRLPDDISMDADVVAFASWCQGVSPQRMSDVHGFENASAAIMAGARKLHQSPWICLALVAPILNPIGVKLPGLGMIDSGMRCQQIMRQPYKATEEEAGAILASQQYLAVRDQVKRARARGGVKNPDGFWFALNKSTVLGPGFRVGNWSMQDERLLAQSVVSFDEDDMDRQASYLSVAEAIDASGIKKEKLLAAIRSGESVGGRYWVVE